MDNLVGKLAVVTGGGSGIGRALVLQLAAKGCHVATCDVRLEGLEQTLNLVGDTVCSDVKVTTFLSDVTDEARLEAFRAETAERHETRHVDILINNAGVSGGGSFLTSPRAEWERTFEVCWHGVYRTTRVFLPALLQACEARLVNISSVNGFWATLGPGAPQTAYSAAKFAVKGFTEALIEDLRLHAPHVGVSLVMPGHIGTSIAHNSLAEFPGSHSGQTPEQARRRADEFANKGLTPDMAASTIIAGIQARRWRILVGDDAEALDTAVRATPVRAYENDFYEGLRTRNGRDPAAN